MRADPEEEDVPAVAAAADSTISSQWSACDDNESDDESFDHIVLDDDESEHEHSADEDVPAPVGGGRDFVLLSDVDFPPLGTPVVSPSKSTSSPTKSVRGKQKSPIKVSDLSRRIEFLSIGEAAAAAVPPRAAAQGPPSKRSKTKSKKSKGHHDCASPCTCHPLPLAMATSDIKRRNFPDYSVPNTVRMVLDSSLEKRDTMSPTDVEFLQGLCVR